VKSCTVMSRTVIRFLLSLCLLLLAGTVSARADQFNPAYLNLQQLSADTYAVLWKVPALDEQTNLKVLPVLPPQAQDLTPRSSSYASGASVQRWQIKVPGGLEGKEIAFSNLSRTSIDVLLRYERLDGTEQVVRLLPIRPSVMIVPSPGPLEVARAYTIIGIEHILQGVDHLLFVLSLVIIVTGTRRLLATVTAFTLAHSITLALATLGVIHVPSPPVEATIALSIVFVASEILRMQRGQVGLAASKPWLVAFAFGLLHGLGFAGALSEVGLPQNAIPLALLFFNVGVEIGQIIFIAAVLSVIFVTQRLFAGRINAVFATRFAAYAIGITASYWVIERIASF
tara:strand:- start:21123 stop:22148 length:1026 start_codon:yes stop_codon:yes gene_type:complete